jgi:hypothetical protein
MLHLVSTIENAHKCSCGRLTYQPEKCARCLTTDCLEGVEAHHLALHGYLLHWRQRGMDFTHEIRRELKLAHESASRAQQLADDVEQENDLNATRGAA